MLTFYVDDSYRDGILAMGGYLAHVDQWQRFEKEWAARLREAGVKVFHATAFFNFQGEFRGWDRKRHLKFAKYFTAIAETNTEIAVGRAVDVRAYQQLVAPVLATHYWTPHGKVTPKMWCARTTLESLILRHGRFLPRDQTLAVVFEEGDGVGEVIEYLGGLKKRGCPWAERINSLSDGPKSSLPLQAADLIMHEAVRSVREKINPTGRAMRKSMNRLVSSKRVEIHVFTRQNLLSGLPTLSNNINAFEQPVRR
jgi:hypothetical protein